MTNFASKTVEGGAIFQFLIIYVGYNSRSNFKIPGNSF